MFHAPRSECLLRDWLRRMRRSSILVSHVEKLCFFRRFYLLMRVGALVLLFGSGRVLQ